MLVARQYETDQSRWSSKFDPVLSKSKTIRMSSYDASPSLQSGWNGHVSVLSNGENNLFTQSGEQVAGSAIHDDTNARLQTISSSGCLPEMTAQGPVQGTPSTGVDSRPVHALDMCQTQSGMQGQSHAEKDLRNLEFKAEQPSGSQPSPLPRVADDIVNSPASSTPRPNHAVAAGNQVEQEGTTTSKEEDDSLEDDDDMLDVEGEAPGRPMTAAERTAARRKMKRFRLTHQQTRFLMSEFAKQPHPDAAHRERLSREIPGLSPRQVQVWFQNRRAKIKRLTADDRDRMIKMRAVPDDFDNVQALHSPYGAVHGLGTPMASPNAFVNSPYGDQTVMRPMMDSIRRSEGEVGMSSGPLSSGYGGLGGYPVSASMSSSEMPSPLSASNERGYFSSHLASPLSAGQRGSNPYVRHGSVDGDSHLQHSPQSMRPLQPLHLRDTLVRTRSDSVQSPLRSSMSWKGDSIDYNSMPSGPGSPSGSSRHQSLYQSDHYETSSYPSSSTNINYSSVPPPSLHQPQQSRSTRLRAATASLPLGLDLRNQYRSMPSNQGLHGPNSAVGSRPTSTTPYSSSGSYPSAPLSAPVDYTQPRTPGVRPPGHDNYSVPQMSAPIAPPSDFGQAMHAGSTITSRTPMRDTFSSVSNTGSGPSSTGRTDDYSRSLV